MFILWNAIFGQMALATQAVYALAIGFTCFVKLRDMWEEVMYPERIEAREFEARLAKKQRFAAYADAREDRGDVTGEALGRVDADEKLERFKEKLRALKEAREHLEDERDDF